MTKKQKHTKVDGKTPSRPKKPNSDDLIMVGIGSSAGGLDALQHVLPNLQVKDDVAYVVVQHLSPTHRSLLTSLLEKHTPMPVQKITEGMRIEPGNLYVAPPDKDVVLSGNRLELHKPSSIGPSPSIDSFFTSLASEKGGQAVGIILSGSGSDGAHGIRAIKSDDGITLAQSPDSASFDSMPRAAINTGLVDLVAPPEEIGEELEIALQYPGKIASNKTIEPDDEIPVILGMLHQRTGVFSGAWWSTR